MCLVALLVVLWRKFLIVSMSMSIGGAAFFPWKFNGLCYGLQLDLIDCDKVKA